MCLWKRRNELPRKAVSLGGKIRVGFENSLFMPNGEIASDNHMKVDAINKLFKLS